MSPVSTSPTALALVPTRISLCCLSALLTGAGYGGLGSSPGRVGSGAGHDLTRVVKGSLWLVENKHPARQKQGARPQDVTIMRRGAHPPASPASGPGTRCSRPPCSLPGELLHRDLPGSVSPLHPMEGLLSSSPCPSFPLPAAGLPVIMGPPCVYCLLFNVCLHWVAGPPLQPSSGTGCLDSSPRSFRPE